MAVSYGDVKSGGIPIFNGEIWEQDHSFLQARTQWLDGDRWILLSTPYKAVTGGCCMMAMTEKDGTMFYTAGELYDRLMREGWRKLPVNLQRTVRDCERYESRPMKCTDYLQGANTDICQNCGGTRSSHFHSSICKHCGKRGLPPGLEHYGCTNCGKLRGEVSVPLVQLIHSAFFDAPVVGDEFTIDIMVYPQGHARVRFTRKDGALIYESTIQRGAMPFSFGVRAREYNV